MKKMNKVIAAMMTMALTFAMPAMAGNKKYYNNDKKEHVATVIHGADKVVVVDKVDKRAPRLHTPRHAYRPDVKVCTFKVGRRTAHKNVVAKAERLHGVMDAYWNPRTREVTVRYDARVTSARHIMHSVV